MLRVVKSFTGFSLLIVLLAACTPYYLVTSEYTATQISTSQAEVIVTKQYKETIQDIQIIAIRAPDACANETTSARTGEASARGLLLKTDCGVEMAELERALVKRGFKVVSWDIIKNMVSMENGKTPIVAARELGAQVLFQINSLERSESNLAQDARWDRRFYTASSSGNKKKSASVRKDMKKQFDHHISQLEQGLLPNERLSATIDVTVTQVKDGQAIWFYQWTHAETMNDQYQTEILLSCPDTCVPAQEDAKEAREELFSGSSIAISEGKRSANDKNVAYNKLIRDVLDDLAKNFSSNRKISKK